MDSALAIQLSAVAAVFVAFAAFAWIFLSALTEGASAYSNTMGEETSREFADAFMFVSPRRIAELGLAAALAAFFLFFIPLFSFTDALSTGCGVVLGGLAAAFAFTLPRRYAMWLRQRRRLRLEEQLVDALSSMSNALKAGFSISQAIDGIVQAGEKPIAQEFSVLQQQLRVGMAFEQALESLDRRVGSDDLSLVCTAIDVARRTGGNLTEIFGRISETIRGRMRIERRVRTLTAQGRLQGIVVSLMPLVLGLAMAVLKPGVMLPFLASAVGLGCMAAALTLVAVGWLIIRRIIKIEV